MSETFEQVTFDTLENFDEAERDRLPFGLVGLSRDGIVRHYNQTEAQLAGLEKQTVIGTHYFSEVAQCMNNFMVAQRFEDEDEIDDTIDYVLTLRMRPTPVKLRLLKKADLELNYILIQR